MLAISRPGLPAATPAAATPASNGGLQATSPGKGSAQSVGEAGPSPGKGSARPVGDGPNANMVHQVASILRGGGTPSYSPRGGNGKFSELALSNLSSRPSYKAANGTLGQSITRVGPSMNWNDGNPVQMGGGYTVRNGVVTEGTVPENDRGWFLPPAYRNQGPPSLPAYSPVALPTPTVPTPTVPTQSGLRVRDRTYRDSMV